MSVPCRVGRSPSHWLPSRLGNIRIVFTGVTGTAALAEIDLSPAARVESFVEKQLGKMHPTPSPTWDTYLWPPQSELDDPALSIPMTRVLNLSDRMAADGTLRWDVPPGDWVILRTGMTTTGTRNSPASPEGSGLEVDKMNRQAAALHFDAFIGELLRRMPARERRAEACRGRQLRDGVAELDRRSCAGVSRALWL